MALVARFPSRSSVSHWLREEATATYESGAVRNRMGLRGRVVQERTGMPVVTALFGPGAPEALTSHGPAFSHACQR